jgi:riboflavin biosynthesis pyrimidine reductase
LLEGGRQVWASFAKAGLLDRLHLVQAPCLMGLPRSMHWTQALNIAAALRLEEARVTLLDDNCLLTAEVQKEGNIGE